MARCAILSATSYRIGTIPLRELDRKTVSAWMRSLKNDLRRKAQVDMRDKLVSTKPNSWKSLSTDERESKIESAGAAAVERARPTLSRMLSLALSQDLIKSNVAQNLDRSITPVYSPEEADTLEADDMERLLLHILERTKTQYEEGEKRDRTQEPYRYGSMLVVALLTGARQAELIGLRWSHVDLERGAYEVERALVLVSNRFHHGRPKTKAGKRRVHLPELARLVLIEHRDAMIAEGRYKAYGLVWETQRGNPVKREYLRDKMLTRASNGLVCPA